MKKELGPTDWLDQIEVIISSCDEHGITTFMNRRGSEIFARVGGYQLIGKSMIDCHPEGSVRNRPPDTENQYSRDGLGIP